MPNSSVPAKLEEELASAIAEYIPELKREEALRVVHEVVATSFRGPMPPPDMLRGYEDIVPGSAKQIIGMAMREQEHRHSMDQKSLSHERRYSMIGIVGGTGLGYGCVCGAVIAAWLGYPWVGVARVSIPMTTMIGKLVEGRAHRPTGEPTPPAAPSKQSTPRSRSRKR